MELDITFGQRMAMIVTVFHLHRRYRCRLALGQALDG